MKNKYSRLNSLEKKINLPDEKPNYVLLFKDGTLPENADPAEAQTVVRINLNLDEI